MKIRLQRLGEDKYGDAQWKHGPFIVRRKNWIRPYCHSTYLIERDGKRLWPNEGVDTLAEAREIIAEELEDKP